MPSTDSWFVQTGFGAVLGPMPADTLRSMVRTQELLPTDLVRRNLNEEWQSASDMPELFPTTARMQADAVESARSQKPNVSDEPTDSELSPPAVDSSRDWNDASSVGHAAPANKVPPPSIPKIVAPPIKPSAAATRYAAQHSPDWRQNARRGPIVAALCVLFLAIWWFWPRSQTNIYPRLAAIWDELKTRRSDPAGSAEMERFLVRANHELDQIIPWLEAHASPKHRELQLLLFASRDSLRVMLKKPRDPGLPQEKRLQILFQAVQEVRASLESSRATAEAIAGQSGKDSAKALDPENTGSALISDPARETTESSGPATAP